jgi:hypothetical protein
MTSTDGVHFGNFRLAGFNRGGCDVKYIPSLRKWVATYYDGTDGETPYDQTNNIRMAFSDDGIEWQWGDTQNLAQNPTVPSCHNPGFMGDEKGCGYETMFLTYGANDYSLGFMFGYLADGGPDRLAMAGVQMDTRQLEWSRISIK